MEPSKSLYHMLELQSSSVVLNAFLKSKQLLSSRMNSTFLMSLKPDLQRRHASFQRILEKSSWELKSIAFVKIKIILRRLEFYETFIISFTCTGLATVHRLPDGNICLSLSLRM